VADIIKRGRLGEAMKVRNSRLRSDTAALAGSMVRKGMLYRDSLDRLAEELVMAALDVHRSVKITALKLGISQTWVRRIQIRTTNKNGVK